MARYEVRLDIVEHKEYGFLGLLPHGAPDCFEPLSAKVAFHDFVEHLPNDVAAGEIHEELAAFGAILWLRAQTGFSPWSSCRRGGEQIARLVGVDLESELYSANAKDCELPEAPNVGGVSEVCRRLSEEMYTGLCAAVRREHGDAEWDDWVTNSYHQIMGWLWYGWRRAEARYAPNTPHQVGLVVEQLSEQLDRMVKHFDRDTPGYIVVLWDDATLTYDASLYEMCLSCEGYYKTGVVCPIC